MCEEVVATARDTQCQQDDERAHRQGRAQRGLVAARQCVEATFQHIVEPVVLLVMAQELRAHHRRQRQRDEAGNQHSAGQRQRELDEELARAAGREGHRRVDRDQRQRHRHDREGDLVDAADRRRGRLHAILDMTVHVLQHHDGVVNDKADGEHHRQQRQRVHGEAERIHQREGADQRDGDRHQRDQRRAHRAQEDEDDQHDQDDRFDDRLVDRLDRPVDEDGGVVGFRDRHALWQVLDDARQSLLDAGRNVERVRRRLLDDADRHRGRAPEPGRIALLARAQLDLGDVLQLDGEAVGILHDDLAELRGRCHAGLGEHREFAVVALDPARRDLDVLRPDGRLDLLHGNIVGRHAGAIEPDAHRILPLAEDADLRHAGDVLDTVRDETVGEIGELERSVPRAGQREIEDRLGVGLDLGDDRLVDLVRQAAAHAADAVAHIRGCHVGVDIRPEANLDEAALLAAGRGDDLDAFDAGDRVLQDLRDLRLDDLGRGTAIVGTDRDDRLVDVRIFPNRQTAIGDDADQHHEQAQHRREDGPADEEFEEAHGAGPRAFSSEVEAGSREGDATNEEMEHFARSAECSRAGSSGRPCP